MHTRLGPKAKSSGEDSPTMEADKYYRVVYDFKQLRPADFEDLTRDLLQQHWHVLLEAFKTGRDQGINLRYSEATFTDVPP